MVVAVRRNWYCSVNLDFMSSETSRIDKWLWTSRFFKTRSLASHAVNGGKVHLNEQRVKAGRMIKVGDSLSIQKEADFYEIVITAINKTRRPAKEAVLTYEESEQSRLKREREREIKKLASASRPTPQRKPDKREREQLRRFKNSD